MLQLWDFTYLICCPRGKGGLSRVEETCDSPSLTAWSENVSAPSPPHRSLVAALSPGPGMELGAKVVLQSTWDAESEPVWVMTRG